MSKILVIDDESWLREMIRIALEQQGFEVLEAVDSSDGDAKARELLPDLILCDVNMGKADAGYVTARAAYELLSGKKVTAGMDLGRPGYKKITIKNNDAGVPIIYGAAWVDVNKDNLKDWTNADGKYKL